jgi:hypothetical protein
MEEVGVLAIAVAIVADHLGVLLRTVVVLTPLVLGVGGLGILESAQQLLVVIDYPGQSLDSSGSVQRVVRI